MSQENVEIVRQIFDAANRRDSASTLALYDPTLIWDHTRGPLRELMGGQDVYCGHEGLRQWFRDFYEVWDNVEARVVEVIEAGDDVISVIDYRARGRASGAEVEMGMAGVWTIQAGKVVRAAWFTTRDEAFEAVGLRE
jgi:ketosteroid isomerase-like protein